MEWRDCVVYDETSPTCLRWVVSTSNRVKVGDPAGSFTGTRAVYAEVRINNMRKRNHQLVWELFNGPVPEGMMVDHINHNSRDNRISNLRLANRCQNLHNRGKCKHNTSGYKGVWRNHIGKWVAEIRANRKRYILGYFDLPEEASAAYNKAAVELHGEFARS